MPRLEPSLTTMPLCHVLVLAVLAAPSVQAQSSTPEPQRPEFCGINDCPLFQTESRGSYEIRTFSHETWWAKTSTQISGNVVPRSVSFLLYMNLRKNYLLRANNDNSLNGRLQMGVPVVNVLKNVSTAENTRFNLTKMFYMGIQQPPAPIAETGVLLENMPSGKIFYVGSFNTSSRATQAQYTRAYGHLKNNLTADGQAFDTSTYYQAAYRSPFYQGLRHYEVWVPTLN